MHERNCDGALAHCGRHALDISGPDIAHRKYPRQTGFEEMGRSGHRPMRAGQVLLREVWPGFDEPFIIKGNAAVEPMRAWAGPGHEEDMSYVVGFGGSSLMLLPGHRLEMIVSFEANDFSLGSQLDGWILFNTSNEIAGHAFRHAVRSDEDMDSLGSLRQKNRRLSCRIASSDHNHFLATA